MAQQLDLKGIQYGLIFEETCILLCCVILSILDYIILRLALSPAREIVFLYLISCVVIINSPSHPVFSRCRCVTMQSMKDNQVWCLVDLPPNSGTIGSKWLFKKKTDMDGNDNSKRGSIPMQEYPNLRQSQGAKMPSEVNRMQRVPYALSIRSIMYAVRCTRPDIAFAQNLCSRFQQKPSKAHWTAVKTILKYLRNTKDIVLVYRGNAETELKFTCYTAASFQTDKDESEYIAAAEASTKAVWMRKFIDGLRNILPINKRPTKMLCDNALAIAMANDLEIIKRMRYYQRKYHYIREVIQNGEIILKKVHIDDNLSDPFIKPMPCNKHFKHVMAIGVCPTSSLI
uniref:Retrotransposon protein, putative, Ty1-copia subclass n=1 Tax=Tanacetum cinerariifolium TaxID=118510 RepID=A0A6L2NHN6_TANCI|nr:hypothetical protein [Tanacetum cinerariifolium]